MLKRVGGEINPEGAVTTIGEAEFPVPFPPVWNLILRYMATGISYIPGC